MTKGRLEAFSDGVIAIIITIMVLEMKTPHEPSLDAILLLWPIFISYVLSFAFAAIYWNNHHHMFHAVEHVNGAVLWANMHLLFWLSLTPFVTSWMGETHFAEWPTRLYGVNLLACGAAYSILQRTLIAANGRTSTLARAIGSDLKGWASLAIYAASIAATFLHPWLGYIGYACVAVMWLAPDPRIEQLIPVDKETD